MSLASALAASKTQRTGPQCGVCKLLVALPKDDAAALNAAMVDASFTGAAISRALKAEGHQISGGSVQRHRKNECQK